MISTQNIRLVDVFLIAPLLIYAGTKKDLATWLRIALIGIGIATLLYNGINYLKYRK